MTTPRISEFSFPTVALIRKGGPKRKNQKGQEIVGQDLNERMRIVFYPGAEEYRQLYLETAAADQDPSYRPTVDQAGQITVTKIRAMIPFVKVWDSLQIYNEAYQAGRMVMRADGTRVITRRDPTTGKYLVRNGEPHEEWEPGAPITYERDGRTFSLPVKTAIRLRLWLPALARMVVFEFKSTSYYDAINLRQQFGAVQMMADMLNGGVAGGIPFTIFRRSQELTWNKPDGSASRVSKWLLQVEVDPLWVAAATQRMSSFAMTGQQLAGLLKPPEIAGTEDPEKEDLQPGTEDYEELPIEGTYDEEPPAPEPEPAAASEPLPEVNENGEVQLRYQPAELRERIIRYAAGIMQKADGSPREIEGQRDAVKQALEEILQQPAAERQEAVTLARGQVQFYLTGYRSMQLPPGGMGPEYIRALAAWLEITLNDDGSYSAPAPMAEREAIAAYLAASKEK